MKRLHMGCAAAWLAAVIGCEAPDSGTKQQSETEAAGAVERLDPAFDRLVPPDAVIEKIADGFVFIEGPVWVPGSPGHLLFSDIPGNTVYRWSEGEGVSVFLQPVLLPDSVTGGVGGSNGLTLDPQGRLVLCEHGNRRIARLNADGSRTTLADRYEGKRLNSPNDIVFHSSGAAFFTDPPYGLEGGDDSPAKELPHNGIYSLDVDGTITLLNAEQTRPNGIGLSPDERILYVANSDEPPHRVWMSYPVLDDLTLGKGAVFFDANDMNAGGLPDGLTLDRNGNVYASGPGGVLVFSPEGSHLGTIAPNEIPANAGWGDDGNALYMTAHSGLYRIKLNTSGL